MQRSDAMDLGLGSSVPCPAGLLLAAAGLLATPACDDGPAPDPGPPP